jgi:hypothetical protein
MQRVCTLPLHTLPLHWSLEEGPRSIGVLNNSHAWLVSSDQTMLDRLRSKKKTMLDRYVQKKKEKKQR